MKVLIVSGFLGAGKTTFIRTLSNRLNKDFVILENEYASINIDKDIIKDDTGLNVWEFTEKCICCSGKADFAMNILTIANTISPEYLIVEPTGVGFLSNVINNISRIEYEQIELLSPVTIIDPNSFFQYIEQYNELLTDQISCAGTVILSKSDRAVDVDVDTVIDKIQAINADANIISRHYSGLSDTALEELLLRKRDGTVEAKPFEAETVFDSISISNAVLSSVGELIIFLEALIRKKYGNIIRSKGTILIGNTPIRFDVSNNNYIIEQADADSKIGCVFIGDGIMTGDLRIKLLPVNLKHNVNNATRNSADNIYD